LTWNPRTVTALLSSITDNFMGILNKTVQLRHYMPQKRETLVLMASVPLTQFWHEKKKKTPTVKILKTLKNLEQVTN